MSTPFYDITLIVLLVVTLLLAGLAASAETALTSVNRIRLRHLLDEGNPRALLIEKLQKNPNGFLTAILTTNTICIVISATAADLLAEGHGLGGFWPQVGVSLVDAIVVLILAEITAKSLAISNLGYALWVAPMVNFLTTLMRVPILGMSAIAALIKPGKGPARPFVTEEELKMMVTVGEEEGIIEEDEREMIHGIIEIGDMTVREAMIPRIDIVAVEVHRPISEVVSLILKHGHTRIPVYEDTIDHIVGVAYAKDLLRHSARTRSATEKNGDLRKLIRPAYSVPENKNLAEFLREMREKRVHMAIVVDEYGQTAGIITIEDIIEEIVGPIRDEYDALEQEEIEFLAPNEAVLDPRISLDDARDELGLRLEADDVDSLGGLIYSHLGTIPKRGDAFDVDGATFTVVSVRGQRIGKVRVRAAEPFPGAVRREEARAEAEAKAAAEAGDG